MLKTTRRHRLGRPVATLAAAALTAGSLATLVAPSAQAADAAAPSFTWLVSQQFHDAIPVHTLSGGATADDAGAITFPNGEGSYNPATGEASITYDGAVEANFAFNGNAFYGVTISEPEITVDATGNGSISAEVSGWQTGGAETTPARVVVTTFTAGAWAEADGLGTLAATPDWAGVLSAEDAAALGIDEGLPVGGQSFPKSFLDQITSGVRAHFYASGADADPKKAPAEFTATALPAKVSAAVPAVAGAATVGTALTATPGAWGPNGVSLSYQWYADEQPIAGATQPAYVIAPAQAGKMLFVGVTGTLGSDTATRYSARTAKVAAGALSLAAPTLKGKAKLGKKLKALVTLPEGVDPALASIDYQWFKGKKAISGADNASLKLRKNLAGKKITVQVTVEFTGYEPATATSKAKKVKKVKAKKK